MWDVLLMEETRCWEVFTCKQIFILRKKDGYGLWEAGRNKFMDFLDMPAALAPLR
jgi:hypothetical protein